MKRSRVWLPALIVSAAVTHTRIAEASLTFGLSTGYSDREAAKRKHTGRESLKAAPYLRSDDEIKSTVYARDK
jgi:hypothetical protein